MRTPVNALTDAHIFAGLPRHLLIASTFIAFCILLNYSTGLIDFAPHKFNTPQGRDTGASLALPVITAFAYIGFFITKNTAANVCFPLSNKPLKRKLGFVRHLKRLLYQRSYLHDRKVALSSILFGSIYLYSNQLFWLESIHPLENIYRFLLIFQTYLFWFFTFRVLWSVFDSTFFLATYIKREAKVQLFQIEAIKPITKSVLINFLAPIFILTLQPLFWLHALPPNMDITIILLFLIVTLMMIGKPLHSIHRLLDKKKSLAVERINESIDNALSHNKKMNRRLVDNDNRLQYVSDLLTVRKEIAEAPTWPIDVPFLARVMFLLAIPFMGWVASSLIDSLVKSFL